MTSIQYIVGDFEFPYPVKYPYRVYSQQLLHNLLLLILYNFPYSVKFPYPVKSTGHKYVHTSEYWYIRNIQLLHK